MKGLLFISTITLLLFTGTMSISDMTQSSVSFTNSQGLTIQGYLSTPTDIALAAQSCYNAVVLLHDCSGIFDSSTQANWINDHLTRWDSHLSGMNYFVLLVDSFTSRSAAQDQCSDGDTNVSPINDVSFDANAAYEFLVGDSLLEGLVCSNNVAVIGFGTGGSAALSALSVNHNDGSLNDEYFNVGYSFYPDCNLYGGYGTIATSTWVPYTDSHIYEASLDTLYLSGNCAIRATAAETINSDSEVEIEVYSNAQHGFDEQDDNVMNGFTEEDKEAREEAEFDISRSLQINFGEIDPAVRDGGKGKGTGNGQGKGSGKKGNKL